MMRFLPALILLVACSGARRDTDSDGTDDTDVDTDTDTDTLPALDELYINEILASNDAAQSWELDGEPQFDDWLEIYNPGDEAIDLTDYGLSDGGSPWPFPEGAQIEAGGHLLVWCSDGADGPGLHTDFAISRGGEVLTLSDPYDRVIDEVDMPEQTTDVVTYRSPDGGETWAFGEGTPGAPNP